MITPAFGLTATERVLPSFTLDWTTGLVQSSVDVARAGVATFVGSNGLIQSAAANTQRIDYSTGVAGLLVEEQRTNMLTYSEDFTNADWTKIRATVASNLAVAPDGTLSADQLIEDTTASNTHLTLQNTSSVAPSVTSVVSVYLKKYSRSSAGLSIHNADSAADACIVSFDLTNGTISTAANNAGLATGATASIEDVGNGWYRCSLSGKPSTSGTTTQVRIALRNSPTGSSGYTGDGTSGIYLWGAQLEPGAFPTSVIPTTSAAVTRNADVATMTGTDFDFFNYAAGTFFIESNASSGDDLLTAGSYVLTADATALKKYATTYSVDPSATQLTIGNGLHKKIMYYPQELIAAELAALTA